MASGRRKYRFDRAARADLRQAALWYEEQRDGLGIRFAAEVSRAIELILRAPERWPVRQGTHRYVLRRFPYTIAYRASAGEVLIVAVAHQHLDPGSWDER